MRLIFPIWVFVLIVLAGCNQNNQGLVRRFFRPEDEATATNYVALLRQGKFDRLEDDVDPSITNGDIQKTLVKMAVLLPSQDPISVRVVGAQQFEDGDTYKNNLSLEYQFPTNWVLVNVALQRKAGITTICGFHVHPMSDSLEHFNRFSLVGKNMLQYSIFVFAILIPSFILGVLLLCIRTRVLKRKWLWVIFILFGFGSFTVNWTTGRWEFGLLHLQLFGAGAFAHLYGAWLVTVSFPLGAIIFLLKRKKLTARPEINEVVPS